MSLNNVTESWKEDVCSQINEEVVSENLEELLEKMNFGEKINTTQAYFGQLCSDYYWELERICQEMNLELLSFS